jgi:hypothetical protein
VRELIAYSKAWISVRRFLVPFASKDARLDHFDRHRSEFSFQNEKEYEDAAERAIAPMRWFIFSHWEMLAEDIGTTFEQKLRLSNEQGQELLGLEQEFTGEQGKTHHRLVAALPGFPVMGGAGVYRITLHLHKKGEDSWEERGSYPLLVKHSSEPLQLII